ncbi:MAG: uncharacterized protein QOI59_4091 [Gammaproteobacteria bacterium]|nr:uncharacterized protein [Gammaproteobacteria bacterium]
MARVTSGTQHRPSSALQFAAPEDVRLGGVLGEALAANHRGRLSHFIVNETSPAIAVFDPVSVCTNHAGDWYGEHAGKWLYAAAKAAARTRDEALLKNAQRVADYLVGLQDAVGYLGNYAPERRFMYKQPSKPLTWDGAPFARTWDIWTHCYLILGLLEVHRHFPNARYLEAACRIGDLCWDTLTRGGIDITDLGNHHGMSATVLVDPALELHFATDDRRYLDLALLVLEQAERNPRHALLTQALAGADASEIATGKSYQILWNLVGLAKLYRATGDATYLRAAENLWRNIRECHLTLGGGPWGGVAHRSREVFNPGAVFSPFAYVETCSTMAWIQLNRELLRITGHAAYAQEIERSAYNDLLGAQAPNGEDWCYYSFPNGKRVHTTFWRCCKSSGAMALEELPSIAYGISQDGGIKVNLFGPSKAVLKLPAAGDVRLEQETAYPFEGTVSLRISPERCALFSIYVRIPEWAEGTTVRVSQDSIAPEPVAGAYVRLERFWRAGDVITLSFPLRPKMHRRVHRNVQESQAPDGVPVSQEVMRFDYLAITRGPLVYATDLIDGYKIDETLRFDAGLRDTWLATVPATDGEAGSNVRLCPVGRPALTFQPYYRAGGRRDGAWRLTWMMLAPQMTP